MSRRLYLHVVAMAAIIVALGWLTGCTGHSGAGSPPTSSASGSDGLWSLMHQDLDYDEPATVADLESGLPVSGVIQGRVVSASAGASYTYPDGVTLETAVIAIAVSKAAGVPSHRDTTVHVEMLKPVGLTDAQLRSAAHSDQQVIVLLDARPMFGPDVVRTDLPSVADPRPDYTCSKTAGVLAVVDGHVRASTPGDIVLQRAGSAATSTLFTRLARAVTH